MISRVHQGVMRVAHQGVKDKAAKRGDGGIKTFKDSSCGGGGGGGSLSKQTRKFSVDSNAIKVAKCKQVEESFRTVMFLSSWGP